MHAHPMAAPLAESGIFRHVRCSLAYGDLAAVREELAAFLAQKGVARETSGHVLLAVSEVLCNLIKHPPAAAACIDIQARVTAAAVHIEVHDDSTPFANFDAKCEDARRRPHAIATGLESGYGLGCILSVCRDVSYTPGAPEAEALNCFRLSCCRRGTAAMRRPCVFLIDDDPILLTVHKTLLADLYDVVTFEDAEAALAAFPTARPDLIISDIIMPRMDGVTLRQALDSLEGGNATPFIFISHQSASEYSPYISQLGIDDFLSKPVSPARLRAVVTRLLRRSEQVRQSVQSEFHHDITALLRPVLPEACGAWRFATHHWAAEAGGGDFIFHRSAGTDLTVALADVMGHGRQAKFFSYVYMGYLHSLFRMAGDRPDVADFLRRLSQNVIGDDLLDSTIMTCQCLRFEADGTLRIASAGHPPPLLLRGGRAETLNVLGPLPGLAGDSFYAARTFRAQPGDRLLFMTDGFLGRLDAAGLAALLAKTTPETLWEHLESRQERPDDATLIIAAYGEDA